MKRALLLIASTSLAVWGTDSWTAPHSLVVVIAVAGASWVIGAVRWPRRSGTWHRREVRVR
jgi:hypothetical protein